ncbi:unnamed protein product [Thlaspi arvense]|uniref:RING-type domain-containing protein n=1 Tax=Thlaspi arvense TaxID=13288 RepID=A0AAU9S0B9_THLAR|nr:unnamed protein product [Thlaspi arvense]
MLIDMSDEQLEIAEIRLAKRLSLFRDYASVLLVANNWDEEHIVQQWNLPVNAFASLVMKDCSFITRRTKCHYCFALTTCQTYGCGHLICNACVKGYVERKIGLHDINMTCMIDHCGVMMCKSVFLNDVSAEFRTHFKNNLLTSYPSYKSSSPYTCVFESVSSMKWIILCCVIFAGLIYRGTCKFDFGFSFTM